MNETLKIVISAVVDNFKKGVESAKKEINTFRDQVKEAGKNVDETMKKAGEATANAAKVMGVGIAAAGAAMIGLVSSTKELRENSAKLISAFEAQNMSADAAKNTYNDLYKIIGDSDVVTEAAQQIALFAKSEEEAAKWAGLASGVVATFGDALTPETFYEAANETIKLNEATGAYTQMLEQSGMNVDEFNARLAECNTEAERQALVYEVANQAMSAAGDAYERNNEAIIKQNEAQASLDASLSQLATTLAPFVAQLTELASVVLTVLIEKLSAAAHWAQEHKVLLGIIAGVIGTVVAAIGLYNAVAAVKAAMDAAQVTTIWGLVSAHIAQAAAAMVALAPYLLIVAAIAAVIAIIVLCIKYWDQIVAAVKKAVQAIVKWVTDLWNSITSGLQEAWNFVTSLLSKVGSWIYDKVIAPVGNFFKKMWNGFKEGAVAAWNGVKQVFSAVANFFGNIFSTAWNKVKAVFSAGGKVFDGIKEGIVKAFKTVVNAIITGINKVVALPFKGLNGVLNTISGLSIAGIQPFSWLTWRAPVPQIPLLAKGGVIDSATVAMIGENGQEAVVPLENNLEWLDKLATMLNDRMGGGAPIVLQVDGKTFAKTAISTINAQTRQTGQLALEIL